jgi:hypothetical protein
VSSVLSHPGRRTRRVIPSSRIGIRMHGSTTTMHLTNLSPGGFAIISERSFSPGTTHRFIISAPQHTLSIAVMAKAIHCHPAESIDPQFITGWELTTPSTGHDQSAINLIIAATGEGNPF